MATDKRLTIGQVCLMLRILKEGALPPSRTETHWRNLKSLAGKGLVELTRVGDRNEFTAGLTPEGVELISRLRNSE